MTDVCLCEYTDHGHCGLLRDDGSVDNDSSLELLARTAVSHARAGADVVAPSDMMDGRVRAIRSALDEEDLADIADRGLQREVRVGVLRPVPRGGGAARPPSAIAAATRWTRRTPTRPSARRCSTSRRAPTWSWSSPALPYLDVIRRVKEATLLPVAAYNVSGEYAMIKAAAAAGQLDERAAVLEALTSIRRAGADIVITYHAKDAARWLQ